MRNPEQREGRILRAGKPLKQHGAGLEHGLPLLWGGRLHGVARNADPASGAGLERCNLHSGIGLYLAIDILSNPGGNVETSTVEQGVPRERTAYEISVMKMELVE